MKILFPIICASAMFLAIGCGTPPKTIEEFRDQASKSSWVETLDYDVPNASLTEVKQRLKKFANKCLRMEVNATCRGPGACVTGPSGTATYTPKITATPKQVTLSVQQLWTKSNVVYTSEPPKGGFFVFLTDVKVGKDSKLHGVAYAGSKSLVTAASNWARDENHLCPNLY
jgi:hypothetical protein